MLCHGDINGPSEDYGEVGEKGLISLVNFSLLHGDEHLSSEIEELQNGTKDVNTFVHKTCRRDYTNRPLKRRSDRDGSL